MTEHPKERMRHYPHPFEGEVDTECLTCALGADALIHQARSALTVGWTPTWRLRLLIAGAYVVSLIGVAALVVAHETAIGTARQLSDAAIKTSQEVHEELCSAIGKLGGQSTAQLHTIEAEESCPLTATVPLPPAAGATGTGPAAVRTAPQSRATVVVVDGRPTVVSQVGPTMPVMPPRTAPTASTGPKPPTRTPSPTPALCALKGVLQIGLCP